MKSNTPHACASDLARYSDYGASAAPGRRPTDELAPIRALPGIGFAVMMGGPNVADVNVSVRGRMTDRRNLMRDSLTRRLVAALCLALAGVAVPLTAQPPEPPEPAARPPILGDFAAEIRRPDGH